jgi:hypothetical protein
MAESAVAFDELDLARYISLTTFKRDGTPVPGTAPAHFA